MHAYIHTYNTISDRKLRHHLEAIRRQAEGRDARQAGPFDSLGAPVQVAVGANLASDATLLAKPLQAARGHTAGAMIRNYTF
jgi:hypothetical protein